MPGIKILFLCSGDQMCRCQIAKNILQSFDSDIQVYAAGIPPLAQLSTERLQAMEELGFEINENDLKTIEDYRNLEFDYLITVSHGVREQLKKYPRNFQMKLHMEFTDFCTGPTTEDEALDLLQKIRDEVENELGYFYYHILKKEIN